MYFLHTSAVGLYELLTATGDKGFILGTSMAAVAALTV